MEIWQVGRRKESRLAPPLRKTTATTCSRRQQPDGQAADTSLHTRHQMSLPPAKLFGDTGRLWGYWWRACRGHRMQTQTKPGFTGSAAHGTAWDVQGNGISEQNWGWKSLDSMASLSLGWPPSLPHKWQVPVWDTPQLTPSLAKRRF